MEVFDKDGNPIEGVFSKDELEAKVQSELDARIKAAEEAEAAEAAAQAAAQQQQNEMPEWAQSLVQKVESLSSNATRGFVERVSSTLDTDRRKEVETKFNQLTGYDETPEGLARRAEDAYLLATGERYNAGRVDMSNLAAAGGVKTQTDSKVISEADKQIQAALGITAADIEKYGKK
jgi:hypothetical protein